MTPASTKIARTKALMFSPSDAAARRTCSRSWIRALILMEQRSGLVSTTKGSNQAFGVLRLRPPMLLSYHPGRMSTMPFWLVVQLLISVAVFPLLYGCP